MQLKITHKIYFTVADEESKTKAESLMQQPFLEFSDFVGKSCITPQIKRFFKRCREVKFNYASYTVTQDDYEMSHIWYQLENETMSFSELCDLNHALEVVLANTGIKIKTGSSESALVINIEKES